MKLHVGCGAKPLDGYLNIDLDDRPGVSYEYLKADARGIPLPDGVADEVLSVHVIEHIWPWEVPALLDEWKRLLKVGGQLVIECPNLETICKIFLAAKKSGNEPLLNMAMSGFYGDPKDRDLPGRHKWGYTPETLGARLVKAGFRNVREEPAQHKTKTIREMRLVCEKQV